MTVSLPPAHSTSTLQVPPNSFIGRDRELAELAELCGRARLVTLTGAPGTGKSRLAAEHATRTGRPAVALDLSNVPVGATGARIAGAAAAVDGAGLLVLDTCEHVIDLCARVIPALLRDNQELCVLATSREALRIAGEIVYPVPPLPAAAAIALLTGRAAERNAHLDGAGPDLLAAICAELDGLPLTLELAAARAAVLTPRQLADRLRESTDLLSGGDRNAPPRHHSFAAALEWSLGLLGERDLALLRALTVFEGAFGLEDAEFVCADRLGGRDRVLDGMTALAARSLLAFTAGDATYRLLRPVRRHLRGGAEPADEIRARHAAWCTTLAEHARRAGGGRDLAERLARVDAIEADVDAALTWCVAGGRTDEGLRLATALGVYWMVRGRLGDGRRWFTDLLGGGSGVVAAAASAASAEPAASAASAAFSGRILLEYGALMCACGEFDAARAAGEQALAGYEKGTGDPGRVMSLILLGNVKVLTDPAASGKLLDEVAAHADEDGRWWTGIALALLGYAQTFTGDLAAARRTCEACVSTAEAVGSPLVLLTGQVALGHVALEQGDYPVAEEALTAGLRLSEQLRHPQGMAMALQGLGALAAARGRSGEASALLTEAVRTARTTASPVVLAPILNTVAQVAVTRGDTATARRACEEVLALADKATTRQVAAALLGLHHVHAAADAPARARALAEEAVTLASRVGDRTLSARALRALAGLAAARGQTTKAWDLHHQALSLMAEIGLLPEIPGALDDMADTAAALRRTILAARMRGAARSARDRLGVPSQAAEAARVVGASVAEPPDTGVADLVPPGSPRAAEVARAFAAGAAEPLDDVLAAVLTAGGPHRRHAMGWSGLTRAEHQVARLAAEGLTNREIGARLFVSPRTVQTHLSHVFTKLGVSRRRELADHMAERARPLGGSSSAPLFQMLGLPAGLDIPHQQAGEMLR